MEDAEESRPPLEVPLIGRESPTLEVDRRRRVILCNYYQIGLIWTVLLIGIGLRIWFHIFGHK